MTAISLRKSLFSLRSSVLFGCARLSSTTGSVESEKISSNIEVRAGTDLAQARSRPMVLLFGWMLAKKRHLDKYGNLYLSKGFDVMNIRVNPRQVLFPVQAQHVIQKVLDTLEDSSRRSQPLMIHGFSVGGYLYGEMLVKLKEQAGKYPGIRERMVGQVFDSPVDFEGVARGFANVLTSNAISQAALQKVLDVYLKVFKDSVTTHYLRSSAAFHENELCLPSLMLYSRADPIGVADIIEMVARKWENKSIPVHLKCWENTPHVSHFHRHPDEYVEAILAFLEEIGLSAPEAQERRREARIP